jgi:SpoIID/LytB domain protein
MRLITGRSMRAAAATTVLAVSLTGAASAAAVGHPSDGATAKVLVDAATSRVATITGSELTFTGHGWGHGRGMGQYGALGYAVNSGWTYQQILGHYYSNTTAGSVGNPVIDVELVTPSSRTWTIVAGNGLRANGVDVGGAGGFDIALVERTGTSSYRMRLGTACGEPFSTSVAATFTGPVEFTVPTQSGLENLVRSCEAGDIMRAYRGSIVVTAHGAPAGITNRLLVANRVNLESYLVGVVPRESPDSWGNLGGGKGLQALKAQTVAARSYAMAGSRPSGAKTCDTTSCQVYGGAAEFSRSGAAYVLSKDLEALAPNARRAVSETSGQVRLLNGAVARTEFSSSTGGYTAGGTFPAVVDAGDAISSNPNRTWTTTMTTAALGQRLFGAGAGAIREIQVTARNGFGDWGGRATQLRVVDAQGVAHTYSGGDRIRSLLGLKSDWFSISTSARGEAENVVRALYQDVLGRGVDPSGLRTWTDYVLATGSPRDLVRAIATSRERMNNLVAAQYRLALRREPEPGGLATWVGHLEAGNGVYALQVGIYSSPEALATLGGGDVATWVGAMYETILGRAAAASEKQFWAGIVASHGRQAVVEAIARSDEATMRRLTVYYQTFLLRGVDASGRATFLPLMTGRGDFDIPVALGSSPEYWARAQTRSY